MFPLFKKKQQIRGTVVLMSKNVLDMSDMKDKSVGKVFDIARDVVGSVIDGATAFLSRSISLQLISATQTDSIISSSSSFNIFVYNI